MKMTMTTAAVAAMAATIFLVAPPVQADDIAVMKFSAGPNNTGATLLVNLFNKDGDPMISPWQSINPASPPGDFEPQKYGGDKETIYASKAMLRDLPSQGNADIFGACTIGFGAQPNGTTSTVALGVTTYPAPDGSAAKCYELTGTGAGVSVTCSLTGGTGQGFAQPLGACN